MFNRIIHKTSEIAGKAPVAGDLVPGEIAINTGDGAVYTIDKNGQVYIVGSKLPLIHSIKHITTMDGTIELPASNQEIKIRGNHGIRTSVDTSGIHGNKTIMISGDQVDAVRLGGQAPSFYAEATHLHDDRYSRQSLNDYTSTLTGGSWYTIADTSTDCTGTVLLQANGHGIVAEINSSQGTINVVSGFRAKSFGSQPITAIRVMRVNSPLKTRIEVYLSDDTNLRVAVNDYQQRYQGWTIKATPTITDNSGFELTQLDISDPDGFDTTGEVREQNQRVFSPNNRPHWSDIVDPPTEITPTGHNHDALYYRKAEVDAQFDAILSGASEQLNSFKELSDALGNNSDAISAINASLATKVSKSGDVMTGNLKVPSMTFNTGSTDSGGIRTTQHGSGSYIDFMLSDDPNGNDRWRWIFRDYNDNLEQTLFEVYKGATGTNNAVMKLYGEIYAKDGTQKVYHAGNDGAGSGLDADLLDGQHGTFYRNASNLNAGTVPVSRLSGVYNIGISGTAHTATTAANAVKLNDQDPSYYLNASNINAGTLPVARLSGGYDISISGNAATASKLATARTITLAGDVTGSVNFDGSGNVSLTTTVGNDSHTHDGRYHTESEADARFSRAAETGKYWSLKNKDNRSTVSPPSDYAMGLYNEFKYGNSVGLTSNSYCGAVTVAPWNGDSGGGNSQLLFQSGALYLRYGTRASGWNNPERVYTTGFKPAVGDIDGALPNSGQVNHSGRITFTGEGHDSGVRFHKSGETDAMGIRANFKSVDNGELEFYTTDNNAEAFVFRHYRGTLGNDDGTAKHEWAKIDSTGLDLSGNTINLAGWQISKEADGSLSFEV